MAAVILGGIGFPVLFEIGRRLRPDTSRGWRRWSLTTRLTLLTTAGLIVTGVGAVLALEWRHTLQPFGFADKLLVAAF